MHLSNKTFGMLVLVPLFVVGLGASPFSCGGSSNGGGGGNNTNTNNNINTSPEPLTAADLAGNGSGHKAPCVVAGSNYGSGLTGTSFVREISYNTSLGYNYTVYIYNNTTCDMLIGELAVYNQWGTYVIGSLTTAGATQIKYTIGGASGGTQLTVYGGVAGGGTLATNLNADCGGGVFAFSTTATSSAQDNFPPNQFSSATITCNTGNLSLPTFYDNNTAFYDAVSLDNVNSPTTLTVSAYNTGSSSVSNIFHPGVTGGYPTSTTTTEVYTY